MALVAGPEVLGFRVPTESGKALLVWGLEEGAEHSLFSAFSEFGLLYSVRVHRNAAVAGPGYYALVKFYSARDASRAQRACHRQRLFQKSPLKLRNISGFDLENEELGGLLERKCLKYLCVVEVTLPHHGICTRGLGVAEAHVENGRDPLEFVMKTGNVQKLAVEKALSGAFQKILLIVLENGKVAVEYNSAQEESIDSLTDEELRGLIQINDLSLEQLNLEEEFLSDFSFDEEHLLEGRQSN
ncbi:RAD52 motif-containing protein 1 isoform X4 [Dermochelys coriacea]|uniref:RAD52 motif-containing protein 1 isoform X4 n=1 Tax=Dermochelys coriacea TaxID=27794 RepID=UPI0018E8AC32|nr:RAD52 motif-containing protein 1 isoform X4 [Dermochelys coriacea]